MILRLNSKKSWKFFFGFGVWTFFQGTLQKQNNLSQVHLKWSGKFFLAQSRKNAWGLSFSADIEASFGLDMKNMFMATALDKKFHKGVG